MTNSTGQEPDDESEKGFLARHPVIKIILTIWLVLALIKWCADQM